MESGGVFGVEGIGRATRIEVGVPECFGGIDIADACDSGLIQQELFQWTTGGGKTFAEKRWSELRRECVDAERTQ